MNILFYRYKSIYEADMLDAFKTAGLNVIEVYDSTENNSLDDKQRINIMDEYIDRYEPLFVYGVNYFPIIAEICKIHNIPYLCQTVDSPILTLFSETIKYPTNRIFLFDGAQYDFFHDFNPSCIYHLPLASAVYRFDKIIKSISNDDRRRFSSDISFVGSTYREKDPYAGINGLSDYTKGYVSALIECCMSIYGYYPVKDVIDQKIVDDFKKAMGPDFPTADKIVTQSDKYVISHEYIGSHVAVIERERTLNALAENFNVDLYTGSDTSALMNVRVHEKVRSFDEMPKIFNLSRINLNITMRPIETGLPLRCFDILGCGGFLMTNYQPEIEDMFIIGKDLEAYSGIEELIDKCRYYLTHEDERKRIAENGYAKVCESHTHFHRLKSMLDTVTSQL